MQPVSKYRQAAMEAAVARLKTELTDILQKQKEAQERAAELGRQCNS